MSYDVQDMQAPRVIRDLEVPNENPHSINTSLLDELEANRARANAQNISQELERNRARLIAEQKQIVSKQAEKVKPRKYDFETVVKERQELASSDLKEFLNSFEG
jgi:hypothetical protein